MANSDSGTPPKGAWLWNHSNSTIAAGTAISRRRSPGVMMPTAPTIGPHASSTPST